MMRFSVYLFFLSFTSCIFWGCYVEKRLSQSFVQNADKISILILEPDLVLLSNIKKENTEEQKAEPDFLKDVDLNKTAYFFMDELKKQLLNYGFNVYTSANIDTFFTMSPPAYMFNIAQLELEEYFFPFKEKYTSDTIIYTQEFLLNAVNLNTWFEFIELNSDKKNEVLFSNFHIKDEINGDFRHNMLTDDVTYVYSRNDITTEKLENLIKYSGKTNGRYIFNHLLNKYIKENLKEKPPVSYFYIYEPETKKYLFLENYSEFRYITPK